MKLKQRVTEYTLYRHRYRIGYTFAIICVALMLMSAALFVPQGIRAEEQASALTSGALEFATFDPETVVYLPYHALQLASIAVFGVSELSIKLPSLILGFMAAIGMFLLIRAWMRSNVAVIAALIGTTTPAFIFAAQDGTPLIFSITMAIWLLLSATYVARRGARSAMWKILLFAFFVLTLYTPLGIYLCIALVSSAIFHPHIRYVIRRLDPNKIAIGAGIGLLLISPLLYSVVMQPSVGLELLGVPTIQPDWQANAMTVAGVLFGFGESERGILRPVISIGVGLLMLVGIYRLIRTRHTARSYVTTAWLLLLLPLIYINPEYLLLILPAVVILVAMGMATLIIEWYRLFPRNPYARVLGLLPLSFIVIGIVLSSAGRYTMSYTASPDVANVFHSDLTLLHRTLDRAEATVDEPLPVVVGSEQQAFYELAAEHSQRYTITTNTPSRTPYIVLTGSGAIIPTDVEPDYIAVTARHSDANRVYLYKPD